MTKAEVLAAFPIGSTVKAADGTLIFGNETGKVSKISGYSVAFLGLCYMVEIVDTEGRNIGGYHPHELEQA